MTAPSRQSGMTLLEVMIAVVILGSSIAALVSATSRALAIVRQARNYEQARRMLGLVDVENPLWLKDEITPGTESGRFESAPPGWSWERTFEEIQTSSESALDEGDGLFLLRTRVYWTQSGGSRGMEETVQHLFVPENNEGKRSLKPDV